MGKNCGNCGKLWEFQGFGFGFGFWHFVCIVRGANLLLIKSSQKVGNMHITRLSHTHQHTPTHSWTIVAHDINLWPPFVLSFGCGSPFFGDNNGQWQQWRPAMHSNNCRYNSNNCCHRMKHTNTNLYLSITKTSASTGRPGTSRAPQKKATWELASKKQVKWVCGCEILCSQSGSAYKPITLSRAAELAEVLISIFIDFRGMDWIERWIDIKYNSYTFSLVFILLIADVLKRMLL